MLGGIDAVLWDFDGVINRNYDAEGFFWSRTLEADYGVSVESLRLELFGERWKDVMNGRRSFADTLRDVLARVGCDASSKTFIDYWMARDFAIDPEVVALMSRVRQAGKTQAIATNNEPYRTQLIWERHGMRDAADHMFSSGLIGHAKPSAGFYAAIENALQIAPERLLLIDDLAKNVVAARERGWRAHHYGDGAVYRLGSPAELSALLFG